MLAALKTEPLRRPMKEIDGMIERMRLAGFRPMVETDLVAGKRAIMVDVLVNHAKRHKTFCIGKNGVTLIQLGLPPTREEARPPRRKMVNFVCILPRERTQEDICHPVDDILLVRYTDQGVNRNDTRWYVEA